jgi:hypothetical protein
MRKDATCVQKALYDLAVARDKYIDNGMYQLLERINCHQVEINKSYHRERELKERIEVLEMTVESMSDRFCHHENSSPTFEENGGLEYADSPGSYHTPPTTSPITALPEENEVPIPIPDRAERTPSNSDQENVPPSCCVTTVVC